MDYEKKYNEALEKARIINSGKYIDISAEDTVLEYIFPELKESEDEKIRRHLIKHFGNKTKKDWNGVPVHSILTWLEKQGKKPQGKLALEAINEVKVDNQNCVKPTDKVEPKFHEGDTMRTWKEANDGYIDGMPVVVSIDDEFYHCTNELIAIKDQDDYEFPPINVKKNDATENLTLDGDMEAESMMIEPAWSEEDEKRIDELTDFFEHCGELHQPQEKVVNWLQSIKQRIGE